MTTRRPLQTASLTRPHTRRRPITRHLGLVAGTVGVALCLSACGANTSADSTPTTPRPTAAASTPPASTTSTAPTTPATVAAPTSTDAPAPGERPTHNLDEVVRAVGSHVHIRCAGTGPVTVLLIAGFEADSAAWNEIEPTIAAETRVCSYDRPGTGTSDPPTSIATFVTQATDLHELLDTVGEPGPYVVVGHSFGGVEAVAFASMFDDVIGLVLVDASPVPWPAAICAVSDDGTDAATTLESLCGAWADATGNSELLDVFAAFEQASTIVTLGSLPMSIITAVDRELPPGLSADEIARLTDAWDRGQHLWQQLSTKSRLISVPDASHYIQHDRPDIVVDEITRLLPYPANPITPTD